MSTYDETIRKMLFWRRIEGALIWVGLLWPLLLFALPPAPILLAWAILLMVFLYVHFARKAHRNNAHTLYGNTDEEDT